VSGHSLGAGALQYFLKDLGSAGVSCPVKTFRDGSPGAEVTNLTTNESIVNFANTNDFVLKVPSALPWTKTAIAGVLPTAVSAVINSTIQSKNRVGPTIYIDTDIPVTPDNPFSQHSSRLYVQEVSIISSFANDTNESPFSATALGQSLAANAAYTGGPMNIAIAGVGGSATAGPKIGGGTEELPQTNIVHIQSGDSYCLAGTSNCVFVWNAQLALGLTRRAFPWFESYQAASASM